jgi:hypothetical protein
MPSKNFTTQNTACPSFIFGNSGVCVLFQILASIQQEEKSFHQQTGIKIKEETSKVLHLEHSFVWC